MILKLTFSELTAYKRRFVSTALAVVLGVAFLSGSLVLSDTVRRTIDGALGDGIAGTDVYVRAHKALDASFGQPDPTIPATTIDAVRGVVGVAAAAVRVSGYAQLVDAAGKPVGDQAQGAPLFGQNWITSPALNGYRIAEGRAPQADDEIVIDRGTARTASFHVGDRPTVLTRSGPQTFTIVGIARFGRSDSLAGSHTVLFTDAAAQALIAEPGQVHGIVVAAKPGVSQRDLAASVRAATGSGVETITGKALIDETKQQVHKSFKPFTTFLLIFAAIALFVGAFIINNTFSILVAQRTQQMALLRAIGARGRQVLGAMLVESVFVGVFASAAGVVTGLGLAKVLQGLMTLFGLDVPVEGAVLSARTVVVCMVVGLIVTVVSAVLPARRAARIAPMAALREVAIDRSATSKRRIVFGSLIVAGGIAALVAGLSGGKAISVAIGAGLVFIGTAVLAPVVTRPVIGLLGAPLPRLASTPGLLARENALRNPKRTARTAGALMIGVSVVAMITIFASSAKSSIAGSIKKEFHGNLVVDSGSFDGAAGLAPELADTLRSTRGVEAVAASRVTSARIGTDAVNVLAAWESTTIRTMFDLGKVTGSVDRLGADGLVVSTDFAKSHRLAVGSPVQVTFADGTRTMTVKATFDRNDEWVTKAWVDLTALPHALDYRIYVKASDPAAVHSIADAYPAAKVLDKKALSADAGKQIDQILGLIYAMLMLAIIIALLGIANTLALSIHERTRELGVLRAVGMTRRQLRSAVRWESVLIALFGTGLGFVTGGFFGWAMVRAMADQGIKHLTVPGGQLVVVVLLALVAGVVAATGPARRAARLDVLEAVRGTAS